jgi:hypothetical protein
MTQTTNTPENFFEKIFEGAVSDVEKLFGSSEAGTAIITIEHKISLFGNDAVNEYLKLSGNPEIKLAAQWFINIAEGIDPALVPFISGIELEFPKIVNTATGVLGEINKPESQQLADGLTAITNIHAVSSVLGSNVKGGINAAIQKFVVSNNATKVQPATDAQLIVSSQIVHAQAS